METRTAVSGPELTMLPVTAPARERVREVLLACFGPSGLRPLERHNRNLEENMEFAQAGGVTYAHAQRLLAYVFSRKPGRVEREAGQSLLTLLGACLASGIDLEAELDREIARVWENRDALRAKFLRAEAGSPLPGASLPGQPAPSVPGGQAQRPADWYWVRFEAFGGEHTAWTPAEWRPGPNAWYSASYSGIPDSGLIVGPAVRDGYPVAVLAGAA